MSRPACFCGCGRLRGLQLHHVIYQQELRRVLKAEYRASHAWSVGAPADIVREMNVMSDRRNLVPAGPKCHAAHHARTRPYELAKLPDSVFEFAAEMLGPGPAYEYLRRRYAGDDPRLDALLLEEAA